MVGQANAMMKTSVPSFREAWVHARVAFEAGMITPGMDDVSPRRHPVNSTTRRQGMRKNGAGGTIQKFPGWVIECTDWVGRVILPRRYIFETRPGERGKSALLFTARMK